MTRKFVSIVTTVLLVATLIWAPLATAQSANSGQSQPAAGSTDPGAAPTIINASDLQTLNDLHVGAGSTVILDFSHTSGTSTLTGAVNNAGTIYAISSNPAVATASLAAGQITNQTGATITTVLPTGGLAGFTNLIPNLSLLMNTGAFANYGTISSAGNLNITAATSFINQGTISSAANLAISSAGSIINQGVLAAMQNVNLMSAIGQITNSGTITANLGNINIMSALAQNIAINNLGGVMQALNGAINVRDSLFTAMGNINIDGGKFLAKELNLYSGTGSINVNANTISGVLNAYADSAHINTSSDMLTLGTIKMSGDPTFYNDIGGISITGDIDVGEALTIIANGDITTTAGVTLIRTTDLGGQGHEINIIAGAQTFGVGTSTNTIATTPPVVNNAIAPIVLVGAGNGGNVDFSASPDLVIDSRSTCANCSGGNVTLAAYANGATGGQIMLAAPTTSSAGGAIFSGGNGGGNNGSVTLVAGAASGIGISTGKIDSTGGSGTAGNSGLITIQTMQPTSSDGNPIFFNTDGTNINGNTIVGDGTIVNAAININNDLISNTNVQVNAGAGVLATPSFVSSIAGFNGPISVSLNTSGTRAYVANFVSNTVSVIDTSTNTIITVIPVGVSPRATVLTPDGTRLYVTNLASNNVTVIDTGTNTVIATVSVGNGPGGIAVNAQGTVVYVTNLADNTVTPIDVATNTALPIINAGTTPFAITVNNANGYVYIGNLGSQDMTIYDPGNNSTTTTPLGFSPFAFGPCPCGTKIYVTDNSASQVVEFLTDTNTTGASIALPVNATGIAINPTGSTAYITLSNASTAVLNTLTNSIVSTAANPGGFGTNSGNFAGFIGNNPVAYVPELTSNSVSVLRTPAITAPNVALTSETGDITATTGATNISATATNDSVVVTSRGDLVSTGGSANTAFQLATISNLTINAPITAPIIDLHAMFGTFTNNSTVTSTGDRLVLATPTIVNNGLLAATDPSGKVVIQSPSGNLVINQSAAGTINGAFTIVLNPSFGGSVAVNGGSLLSDPSIGTVYVFGIDGFNVQMNLQRLDGELQLFALTPTNNPSSVNVVTLNGDLLVCGCIITSPATTGNGGPITLAAKGGNLLIDGGLQTDANGAGFTAGNIALSALNDVAIAFGGLSAQGVGGASGGTISVVSQTGDVQMQNLGFPGAINVSAAAGNGGTVFISGNNVGLVAENSNFSTIDASGINAGTITVISKVTSAPFEVGLVCGCTINGTPGTILADGLVSGGRINLQVAGGLQVDAGSAISASGTTNGGKIQISGAVPGVSAINFQNDGFISANDFGNANGIIAFNTGAAPATITGAGFLVASQSINFGMIDPVSLQAINPLILASNNPFNYNQYNATQGAIASPLIMIGQGVFIPAATVTSTAGNAPTLLAALPPNLPGFTAPLGASGITGTTITPNDQNDNSVPTPQNQFLGDTTSLQGGVEEWDNAPTVLNGYRVDAINGQLLGPALLVSNYDASRATLVNKDTNILVVASDDIVISTRLGDVHIAAGSMVFIANSPNAVAIFNLHDPAKGKVFVDVKGVSQRIVVGLGYETLLTDDPNADFSSVNPTKLITTRGLVKKNLADNLVMYDAEFSLPAALNAIVPLHDMRLSNIPADKSFAERVIRNAAILQLVASGKGPFKP